ncbi:MAG TPA: 2-amino-4-hydroxy-6-hydroxymethyldihydropteridine diphosphokinase [Rudaea sp.]|jgi:2-amino-4-hydroxy-6-hydroxymethyldihydropteridine diphosphokinase|nr:2-amino-4-hydroxy-6-hydroxymethyldihydropteridine diphosphokinase [Rudaea sp.]
MTRVYLSLGSNVDSENNLRSAIAELREKFGDIDVSPTYRFAAVGFEGPDFLNLAVGIDTELSASALNDWLRALEDRHGRRRDVPRYSNRTLDIDIVLFGDDIFRGPGNLDVPRKELMKTFVMQPLADIAPDAVHPVLQRSIGDLWRTGVAEGERGEIAPL